MKSWRRRLSQGGPKSIVPRALPKVGPGMMVTPNVRLESLLGEGAMGAVWKASHLTLRTAVAVKFVSDALASRDQEVLTRFEREASTAAQIKSQHVVQTFDYGLTEEGVPYIVMEYLDGESLGDRLERTGWLSVGQTGQVVAQTAKALNAAHRLQIVHRDIKPDNIFLASTADGLLIKVLDFGVAKRSEGPAKGLTNPGVLVGTPEFMSPEQILTSAQVDHQADIWGLAVVAYLCLTGELPFTGDGAADLCMAILKAQFKPPSKRRAEIITPAIDSWFARTFHRKLSERFPSAKEMALAFVRAIPPGHEDLEDELMQTGEHYIAPELRMRPPTSIAFGGVVKAPAAGAVGTPATAPSPQPTTRSAPRPTAPRPDPPRAAGPRPIVSAPDAQQRAARLPPALGAGVATAASPVLGESHSPPGPHAATPAAGPGAPQDLPASKPLPGVEPRPDARPAPAPAAAGPPAPHPAPRTAPTPPPAATEASSDATLQAILDPTTMDGLLQGGRRRLSPKVVFAVASVSGVLALGVALGLLLSRPSGPAAGSEQTAPDTAGALEPPTTATDSASTTNPPAPSTAFPAETAQTEAHPSTGRPAATSPSHGKKAGAPPSASPPEVPATTAAADAKPPSTKPKTTPAPSGAPDPGF